MKFIKRHVYSPYVPWRLLGGLALPALAFIVYYLTQIVPAGASAHTGAHTYITGVIISVIGMLYAAGLGLLCLRGLHWPLCHPVLAFRGDRQRFSPLLLGAGLFCYALSQAVWLCNMLIIKQLPAFPSLEQWTELGIYPLLIGAILLLPTPNLALWSRLRIFLDALMIMAAVTTLCYYFLLAPLLVKGEGTPLAKSVSGIFLAGDQVLVFCLLLVALRSGKPLLRPVLIMLFLAILLFFIIHVVYTYEVLYLRFNEFSRANMGLCLAGTLVVGAAQTITNSVNAAAAPQSERVEQANVPFISSRWKAVLPSVLALIFSLLIFIVWVDGSGQMFPGQIMIVYAGGFAVLILMVIRQLLTLLQINFLRHQLQTKNRALHFVNRQLEQQAITDPLTGLPNHRALVEKLDVALAKAQAGQTSCAVIFMDIDHFKMMNDCYGHTVGDQVLCQFGKLVQESLPAGACVGRWGGEEFVALLPHSDSLEALNIAERIRARVEGYRSTCKHKLHVTCSLGVASYPQDASTREELLLRADQAMYMAKRLGRNQVRTAHEPLVRALSLNEAEPEGAEREEMLVVVDALLKLLETRDLSLGQHARRVSALSLKLALMLGLNGAEAYIVSLGGLLHDLGKVTLPDMVLWPSERLDDVARSEMHLYPLVGAKILAPIGTLRAVAVIVRAHRECMDGSGYPDGLRGEEIPLGARIVAVADAYDSLTSRGPAGSVRTPAQALSELWQEAGSRFDARVVKALARLLEPDAHLLTSDVA